MDIPEILTEPPEDVSRELMTLQDELDREIPRKIVDENLLIATWNIRSFGGLTEKWQASQHDSPKRDLHALRCIGEIISRFDIVAIQEAKGNIKALRHMLKLLGPSWGLVLTDVTKGSPGNNERMAFVFDTRRVQMSGLACELVVPAAKLSVIGEAALRKQFARTPYAVSFRAGGSPVKKPKTFILVTLHVLWGNQASTRIPELKAIADWLTEWANDINAFDHNLIALGDFNIDRVGSNLYDAFTSKGIHIPRELHDVPRTIFADPNHPDLDKFYDQIAWFNDDTQAPALSLTYKDGGYFDFTQVCLTSLGLTKTQLSWRMSDHFPLWVEFSLD